MLGGQPLPSRQPAAWQVRVWDASGEVSAWSAPAGFETGLLQQSDWGSAKWIELAGRNNTQPLPIFARAFSVDKTVKSARLYMSGLGLFEAQLNGSKLTDEVLAPGYTNYQLSAEYRTYDVTGKLRGGANTLGVELGNGTANNIKMANPAVGRTNSFAWWNSTAVGSGTLTAPAAAGATNVSVSSVANYYLGGTINVDTGDGGDRLESRTITAIGTAPASTTLAVPAAAGDTNVKLNSVTGMAVGGKLNIGSETKTITEVGTAAVNTTLAAATIVGEAPPPPPSLQGASWLWNVAGHSTITPAGTIYVRKTFDVTDPASIGRAQLRINADDSHVTYVNGQQVAQSGGGNNAWQTSQIVDVKPRLVAGTNVIAVAATNAGGAGGLIGALELDSGRILTDTTWKALEGTPATPPAGWNTAAFDDSSWPAAFSAGQYGIGPWNQNVQTPATPNPSVLRVAERDRLPGRRPDHRRHGRQPGDADGHGRGHRRGQRDGHHGQRAADDRPRPGRARARSRPARHRRDVRLPAHAGVCGGRRRVHARHRHHVHAGARLRACRGRLGHRLGQPAGRARPERGRDGHAAADRPARDRLHRRLDRDGGHEPRLALRVRPDGHRPLVRGNGLRRPPRAGRLDGARRGPLAVGVPPRRHGGRLAQRRDRAAAEPHHQARGAQRRAGEGPERRSRR